MVWELTLACDQPCTHCGSRAGTAREKELTTSQAIDVVGQLAELGAKEVVVIGGEAYLHPGFLEIVAALKAARIRPVMTTGGRAITAELARDMARAGLEAVSVSIDGLEETHDLQRAARGSFESATAALGHLRAAGILTASNTNFNRHNRGDLEGLYAHLKAQGIRSWQVQLTVPLGRAADRPDLILQPWDLLDLIPRIVALKEQAFRDGILIQPSNNVGYFGPEERLLRSVVPGGRDTWQACPAGRYSMGIESDGAVKGCPSLQTSAYVGGNVLERSLRDIWENTPELAFSRNRTVESLWGFCRTCPFAESCLAGCTFTSHAILGRPGNNPYCHFRARTLAKQGKRERLVPAEAAPGAPFDNGRFDLVVEPFDAPDPQPARRAARLKVWREA
ncbi:MAG TPA: radical SAM protein [Solirubrobacteraceae bacterium]|nr:radical SAM protein [Solirubrobacteraceae bacterium]